MEKNNRIIYLGNTEGLMEERSYERNCDITYYTKTGSVLFVIELQIYLRRNALNIPSHEKGQIQLWFGRAINLTLLQ
jgi:hypothetical protein